MQINYFGQESPVLVPQIFAPGVISVENKNTHALIYSPDGKLLIFSRYPDRESYIMYFDGKEWSDLVKAPLKGKEVSFFRYGDTLYYYTHDDLYYVIRKDRVISKPVRLNENINTSYFTEYYPAITNKGRLYFSRNGKWDQGRIMVSEHIKGEWAKPTDLGDEINRGGALHAYVDKDEQFMLFNSPREGGYTKLDIWVSFPDKSGGWAKPVNVGPEINGKADALVCPTVSPDGKYIFGFSMFIYDSLFILVTMN